PGRGPRHPGRGQRREPDPCEARLLPDRGQAEFRILERPAPSRTKAGQGAGQGRGRPLPDRGQAGFRTLARPAPSQPEAGQGTGPERGFALPDEGRARNWPRARPAPPGQGTGSVPVSGEGCLL
ncbi:MAG: hypothetical protein LBT40_12605, partial [Deltaproteobacteria bacterium]|nr:hypothetical protein [Deltaproteobacteria bacterium]